MSGKAHDPNEDENLKWVEEHIPTAGVDSALPKGLTGMDSDEEKERAQETVNKMQWASNNWSNHWEPSASYNKKYESIKWLKL